MTTLLNTLSLEQKKMAVWQQCRHAPGLDPTYWRVDEYGNRIWWLAYGRRDHDHGWEIDHRQPNALGGSSHLPNLRALHWRINAGLGGLLGALMKS